MENFKLYHQIFLTVKRNPGITSNQLAYLIEAADGTSHEEVMQVVNNMMYQNDFLPRCLNYHIIPKEKTRKGIDIVHLRVSPRVQLKTEELLSKYQSLYGYTVTELIYEKNATVLKKA